MKNLITSFDNKIYKELKKLNDKKYRDKYSKFFIEGDKIFLENLNYEKLIVKESKYSSLEKKYSISSYRDLVILSDKLFDGISSQINTQGIIGLYRKNITKLEDIKGDVVVLDDVQDPGNLGTIIRTMLATNYLNLILTKGSVDVYSPKVVRATMGSIFKINIVYSNKSEIINHLKNEKYNIISTSLSKDSVDYREVVTSNKNAYIFGNEGNGVSKDFLDISNQKSIIPIYGDIESLNVSISLAVFLYKMRESN